MKGEKFYKIVITVLIMLNVSTITFIWFGKPPHPPKPGIHLLSNELGLTGLNKTKVDAMERVHHKEKQALKAKDLTLHKKLYEAIGAETNVDSLQNEIATNKEEIEKMTFDFFDDVAQYCDSKQLTHLKEFVHGAFEQLRPMHPPHK